MIALTSGDAALDLRELAADVRTNGWETYTRDHVASILEQAASAWEMGEDVCPDSSGRPRLTLVQGLAE